MTSSSNTETDLLPCGVVYIDENRKVLYGNRYALNLMSCEPATDIAGLHIEDLVSFASRIFLNSYVYPMLLNEGKVEEIQLSLNSMEGEKKPVVANIKMNSDKTTCWTIMSCFNRNQLYNELLTARDTLQSQAQGLTQLNDKIQQRQSDLQAFCYSLSHDFSAPVRQIHQLIGFAMEDLQERGVEAHNECKLLKNAQENSDTLIEITKGLVEYLVADVAVPCNEVVDLEEIVSSVLSMLEELDSSPLKLHRTSLPTIRGSKAQIHMVFKNLIENAIKYNENDPEITVSHTENIATGQLIITIEDNGIGMSDKYLDRIFTPFTRLNSAAEYKGSGLGLSIVKKMVMNHDGVIRVESTPGSGSTFYVSLPLRASSSDET